MRALENERCSASTCARFRPIEKENRGWSRLVRERGALAFENEI